ncbi:MAG: hypothetical protein ABFS12_04680 [Bacteroidota bacterium]
MYYKVIISLLFLFVLIGCNNSVENNPTDEAKLQICFQNNSSYQLNNLTVSNKLIGSLESKLSSQYIAFESFGFDTGMPDENANAVVNGKTITNHNRGYWCGTEKIKADSGKYLIKIAVIDTVLHLSCENAPTIDYP